MSRKLPALIDCRGLQDELGVKRAAALAIMEKLPKVRMEGVRKVWVKRADVEKLLEESAAA